MKKIVIIFLITLVLIGILFFSLFQDYLTGETVKEIRNIRSYTKAICNETNYCQDYEIACEGDEVVSISPILGAAIQHSLDWEDPRDGETIDTFCE